MRLFSKAALFLVVLGLVVAGGAGEVWGAIFVEGHGEVATLREAVAVAPPGGTIRLLGDYTLQEHPLAVDPPYNEYNDLLGVIIDQSITLEGQGNQIIVPTPEFTGGIIFTINNGSVVFNDLFIIQPGTAWRAVLVEGISDFSIYNSELGGFIGEAIYFMTDGSAVIEENIFENNFTDINFFHVGNATLSENKFLSTQFTAIANNSPTQVHAMYNWWGHRTGPRGNIPDPFTSTLAQGSGAAIAGSNIRFDPWYVTEDLVYHYGQFNLERVISGAGVVTITRDGQAETADSFATSYGDEIHFTAYPFPYFEFTRWEVDGFQVGTESNYTLNVTGNHLVKAVFYPVEINVPRDEDGNLKIEQEGEGQVHVVEPAEYTYEKYLHLEAQPATFWEFAEWRIYWADGTVDTRSAATDAQTSIHLTQDIDNITVVFSYVGTPRILLNGQYYFTIQAAVAAASDGDTIYLTDNYTLGSCPFDPTSNDRETIVIDKDISFYGNHFTISVPESEEQGPIFEIEGGGSGNVQFGQLVIDGGGNFHRYPILLDHLSPGGRFWLWDSTIRGFSLGVYAASTYDNIRIEIDGNTFDNNTGSDVYLGPGVSDTATIEIHENNFLNPGNKTAVYNNTPQGVEVDAMWNFWGAPCGPSGKALDHVTQTVARGAGAKIERDGAEVAGIVHAEVRFDPWYVDENRIERVAEIILPRKADGTLKIDVLGDGDVVIEPDKDPFVAYRPGEILRLTAEPAPDVEFYKWVIEYSDGTRVEYTSKVIAFELTQDIKSITANFFAVDVELAQVGPGYDFQTITDAIASLMPGGVVMLMDAYLFNGDDSVGTVESGGIVVDKPLIFKGEGFEVTVPLGFAGFRIEADGVYFDNVNIIGAGVGTAVSLNGTGSFELKDSSIEGFRYGIYANNAALISLRIVRTEFNDVDEGMYFGANLSVGANIRVSHCIFDPEIIAITNYSPAFIDASLSYWGDATGPSGEVEDPVSGTIAEGEGAEIAGENVRFYKWYTDAALTELYEISRVELPRDADGRIEAEVVEGEGTVDIYPIKGPDEDYESGEEITLVATPAEGYQFAYWRIVYTTGAEIDDTTGEELKITLELGKDIVRIEAYFFAIMEIPEPADIVIEGEGDAEIFPEKDIYEPGDTIRLIATPEEGFEFEKWVIVFTDGPQEYFEADLQIVLEAGRSIDSITAHFVPAEYTLSFDIQGTGRIRITQNGDRITLAASADLPYPANAKLELEALPDEGAQFVKWIIDNEDVFENPLKDETPDGDDNRLAVEKDHTVVAVFTTSVTLPRDDDENVEIVFDDEQGSAEIFPKKDTYEPGDTIRLLATPEEGYEFEKWVIVFTDGPQEYFEADLQIVLEAGRSIESITAHFVPAEYTVAFDIQGSGRIRITVEDETTTITASEVVEYPAGADLGLEAAPDEGYGFVNWIIDNEDETEDETTLTVKREHTVVAVFSQVVNVPGIGDVVVTPDGAGQVDIFPEKEQYSPGDLIWLEATPNEGYQFDKWVVRYSDGIVEYELALQDIVLQADRDIVRIEAHFRTLIKVGDVEVEEEEGGSVVIVVQGQTLSAMGEGDGYYEYGTLITMIATPKPGFKFSHWIINYVDGTSETRTESTTTIKLVKDIESVKAVFVRDLRPEPPQGLTAVPGEREITLRWYRSISEDADQVTSYRIYSNTQSFDAAYMLVGTVDAEDWDTYEFTHAGLTPNMTYYYYVRSFYSHEHGGESRWTSNRVSAVPGAPAEEVEEAEPIEIEPVAPPPAPAPGEPAPREPAEAGGDCFIATAAYGSCGARDVIMLRNYRDGRMMVSSAGSRIAGLYYRLSPAFADVIRESRVLRALIRLHVRPVAVIAGLLAG